MILKRTLSAEWLKLRRTLALGMVLIAPLAVLLLTLFMASQAPFSTLRRNPMGDAWGALVRVNLQFWGLLMLPLYFTLQTALLSGLDHADNQWKAILARPVPRWSLYLTKLIVVIAMVMASGVILVAGTIAEGVLVGQLTNEARFPLPPPVGQIAAQTAQMTGLAFLPLVIQLWVSLRWRSFSVAVGFGGIALVTSFAMLAAAGPYGAWPQYFPWSLPLLVVAREPQPVEASLWIAGAVGVLIAAASCVDFCRREVA